MANSADPDQLASAGQLIWIYNVCKGKVYPGSAGQGLKLPYLNLCLAHEQDISTQTYSQHKNSYA